MVSFLMYIIVRLLLLLHYLTSLSSRRLHRTACVLRLGRPIVHKNRKGNYTNGHDRRRGRVPPREHPGAQLCPAPTKREPEQIVMGALLLPLVEGPS